MKVEGFIQHYKIISQLIDIINIEKNNIQTTLNISKQLDLNINKLLKIFKKIHKDHQGEKCFYTLNTYLLLLKFKFKNMMKYLKKFRNVTIDNYDCFSSNGINKLKDYIDIIDSYIKV